MREYLATSEVDLLMAYTEFKATPIGQSIDKAEFLEMPMQCIFEVIRLGGERDKRLANTYSMTTARLTSIVVAIAQSFGGGKNKAKQIPLTDYLPFDLNPEHSASRMETQQVIKKLIQLKKLPVHVIAALNKVITT